MRVRLFFLVTSIAIGAGGLALQACGSDADPADPAPVPDAGVDAAEDATPPDTGAKDAGIDVRDSAPPCDTTKDITSGIADASIADGATTTGLCLGCAKASCKADLDKCSQDCACQGVTADALDCFLKTQAVQCGLPFLTVPQSTQTIGLAILECLQTNCATECPLSPFLPDGGDGG